MSEKIRWLGPPSKYVHQRLAETWLREIREEWTKGEYAQQVEHPWNQFDAYLGAVILKKCFTWNILERIDEETQQRRKWDEEHIAVKAKNRSGDKV